MLHDNEGNVVNSPLNQETENHILETIHSVSSVSETSWHVSSSLHTSNIIVTTIVKCSAETINWLVDQLKMNRPFYN